ncbi:MAG: flagellar basal body-associated protein FliL [Syntrophaceae bacterium]
MAKEDPNEAQPAENGEPKKKKSFLKWIIIGVAALAVIGGGTFGAMQFLGSAKEKKQQQAAPKQAPAALWPMEPFIVNLADNQGDRYLKVTLELEVSDNACLAELNQIKPKLRDNILDLLTAKTYRDLMDLAGKQRLRDEIGMRLNSFLGTCKVTKVYITEFVIQ